jgi:hypothetical protein
MSVIDKIMSEEAAKWVNLKIEELPDRAKFRAYNSIRSLNWANTIFYEADLPIPACYCAMHATEEAIAAFISSAKESGYGDDAKINIKDHQAKATISLLSQKLSNILSKYSPAVAHEPKSDTLVARLSCNGELIYHPASVHLIHFRDSKDHVAENFFDDVVKMFDSDIGSLRNAVLNIQEARNGMFYADSCGYPSGFDAPEQSLERECQISLGLIWASIDIHRSKGELAPLIVQVLRTANMIIAELKISKLHKKRDQSKEPGI